MSAPQHRYYYSSGAYQFNYGHGQSRHPFSSFRVDVRVLEIRVRLRFWNSLNGRRLDRIKRRSPPLIDRGVSGVSMSPASMASAACVDEISAAGLFLRAVAMVPAAHYLAASLLVLLSLFYNLFEFHFLRDLLHGFRGDPVVLTFNPASKIYEGVVSKCRIFHRR